MCPSRVEVKLELVDMERQNTNRFTPPAGDHATFDWSIPTVYWRDTFKAFTHSLANYQPCQYSSCKAIKNNFVKSSSFLGS